MSKHYNDRSRASDPGQIAFCKRRYRRMVPNASGLWGWLGLPCARDSYWEERLAEHLRVGDSRAACVVSIEPLLVAAYTDEFDCIAMLRFPAWLVEANALRAESRLLTVNSYHTAAGFATYQPGAQFASDLIPGPRNLGRYVNFFPVIADFVSTDVQRIDARKLEIAEEEWSRCRNMGYEYRRIFPERSRDGTPTCSWIPAT